ncbi:MAG: hypothetical protein EP344_03205 [Bacteroidetes bacterium]|nr:MAG: hypothetical protein EP344_03205 [Bacteroidota bacterium]
MNGISDITSDPVLFGLLWLLAVLVGSLIGWNLRAFWPEREMVRLLERTTQERNALARLYTQIKHHYELREADLRKTTIQVNSLREQVDSYESERAFLLSTAQANTVRLERAEANAAQWAERLPELEAENARLLEENEVLDRELTGIKGQLDAWRILHKGFSQMYEQLRELEEKNAVMEEERLRLLEELEIARSEVEQQQRELARYATQLQQLSDHYSASASDGDDSGPTQTPGQPDNLLRIQGISPEQVTRLHELGIFTFVQISQWEIDDIVTIAKVLGIPATLIVQQNWIGQAQVLVAGPQP